MRQEFLPLTVPCDPSFFPCQLFFLLLHKWDPYGTTVYTQFDQNTGWTVNLAGRSLYAYRTLLLLLTQRDEYNYIQPEGGVRQGATFVGKVISRTETTGAHRIPMGYWRYGICHCCNSTDVLTHPYKTWDRQCCLSLWCCSCALGQLLTRMKLNWVGSPFHDGIVRSSAFRVWCIATFLHSLVMSITCIIVWSLGVSYKIYFVNQVGQDRHSATNAVPKENPRWISAVEVIEQFLSHLFLLVLLIATIRLRAHIRRKYRIPEVYCRGCEDLCCALCCGPCIGKNLVCQKYIGFLVLFQPCDHSSWND